MKKVAFLFVALMAFVQVMFAQKPAVVVSDKPGWHKIGECTADFKKDTESISVLGKDKFKSIKLKTTDAPINIDKVTITFEDESTQDIPFNGLIAANTESKTFALEDPREIKKVSFTYKSEPNYKNDKAHVELYGLK